MTLTDHSPIRVTSGGCRRLGKPAGGAESATPRSFRMRQLSTTAGGTNNDQAGLRSGDGNPDRRSACPISGPEAPGFRAPLGRAAAWRCTGHALCSARTPPTAMRETAACRPTPALARRLIALCRELGRTPQTRPINDRPPTNTCWSAACAYARRREKRPYLVRSSRLGLSCQNERK